MTAHRSRPMHIVDEATFIEILFAGTSAPRANRFSGVWHPPTDLYETDDRVIVMVEVPGVDPDRFVISLLERRLVITGTRYDPNVVRRAYHQMEIHFGEFRTEVELPCVVDEDRVDAEYREGLLRVTLPKLAQSLTPFKD